MNPHSEQQIKYVHLISMSSSLIVINYVKSTSNINIGIVGNITDYFNYFIYRYPKDAQLSSLMRSQNVITCFLFNKRKGSEEETAVTRRIRVA